MRLQAPRRSVRLRWRKLLAYALCVLIFGGAVVAGLHWSVPPDPVSARLEGLGGVRPGPRASVEDDVLVVKAQDGTRKYRLRSDGGDIVAEEINRR